MLLAIDSEFIQHSVEYKEKKKDKKGVPPPPLKGKESNNNKQKEQKQKAWIKPRISRPLLKGNHDNPEPYCPALQSM